MQRPEMNHIGHPYFKSKTQSINKAFIIYILSSSLACCLALERGIINLNMPNVRPTHDESYLCRSHRLNTLEHEYIVGFQPNASASKVHHILIYGCSSPGKFLRDTPDYVWECGEMNLMGNEGGEPSPYDTGPVCSDGGRSTILFGWALDAPAVEMPPNVGFKIGGDSGSDSGITKLAGIYLLLSYGYVRKGISRHSMECEITEDKVLHPFRFRTHTHKLGTKVAAFNKPATNPEEPLLIGEHNPQEPQMFYPVENKSLVVRKGDRIFAYCDYNNIRDHVVYIGATGNDEMCNFYMMYWTDGDSLLQNQDCMMYNPR